MFPIPVSEKSSGITESQTPDGTEGTLLCALLWGMSSQLAPAQLMQNLKANLHRIAFPQPARCNDLAAQKVILKQETVTIYSLGAHPISSVPNHKCVNGNIRGRNFQDSVWPQSAIGVQPWAPLL